MISFFFTKANALLFCLFLIAGAAAEQDPVDIYRYYKDNVASVKVSDYLGRQMGDGTAVYLGSNAFITNSHVVEGGGKVIIVIGNEEIPVISTGLSQNLDIAYLFVSKKSLPQALPNLPMSSKIDVGQRVYVISNPVGLSQSITDGIVSSLRGDEIQHTASVSPGSSGGAIFSSTGHVIDIVTSRHMQETSIGFGLTMSSIAEDALSYEENYFNILEHVPLLNGRALVSMTTHQDTGAVEVGLIEPSNIHIQNGFVNYYSSTRIVSGEDGKNAIFMEFQVEYRINCRLKKWTVTGGRLFGYNHQKPAIDNGGGDGSWHPIPEKSRVLVEGLCNEQIGRRNLYFEFRKLHSYIAKRMPMSLYRHHELIDEDGHYTPVGQAILNN